MKTNNKKIKSISRKDFLGSSASILGGAAFLSSLPMGASAYVTESNTLKIALIGCGGRGTGAANMALRTDGPVELVAMADAFRDRLNTSYNNLKSLGEIADRINVPEEHKFVGFDAYKKAIELADVVLLVTPPAFRPIHFEAAIQANKHVFMEKPLASDATGVRKILAAGRLADEKGLKVAVGLQSRYSPANIELIKRIHDGAIGDIVSIQCDYIVGSRNLVPRQPGQTEMEAQMRNWRYFNWLWAASPAAVTIHFTDVAHWGKNDYPVRAVGVGARSAALFRPDHGDVYDTFHISYEYADGCKLHSTTRNLDGCDSSTLTSFQGTKGFASRSRIQNLKGETIWQYSRRTIDRSAFQLVLDKLFSAIRNNDSQNDTEWAAYSTMTSLMGSMSAHSGKFMEWDDAFNSETDLVPYSEHLTFDSQPPVVPDENGNYPVPIPGRTTLFG